MLNDIITDTSIDRVGTSERELAIGRIKEYRRVCPENKAIFIFDRGYPSKELIQELEKTGLKYVIRFGLSSGIEETLITNLYELSYKSFKKLYFMRWPVETKYGIVKNKLALENFSGYSKNTILQDYWDAMTLSNLCAIARNEMNEQVKKKRRGKE
jgi:hypothetical protein